MSAKRKRVNNKPPSQPLVRIDENGKVWALPVNWSKELPRELDTSEKSGSSVTRQDVKRRKFIPIEKLNPTPYIYEDSPFIAPKKTQGLDNKCIRKELFKVPENKKSLIKRPDATSAIKSSTFVKEPPTNEIPPGTPLMELEQAEKLIEDKPQNHRNVSSPFKPVEKLFLKFGTRNMVTPSRTHEVKLETVTEETSDSKDSNTSSNEFLALEEQCCNSVETKSPLTNVCNLLQNTRLNRNTPKDTPKRNSPCSVASKVEKMLEKWNERLDVVKKQHEEDLKKIIDLHNKRLSELQEQQAQDMIVIKKLLQTPSSSTSKDTSTNKENRRSTRIAEQAVSPVISKGPDLRKSTLKKNLSKNIEIDQNPRLKKAVDLYNDLRGNCSILGTPRMSRNEIVSPGNTVKKSLSRRIQEQCLLLQETPR